MRIAIISEKTAEGLSCELGIMPDPSCFPVKVTFGKNNKLTSINANPVSSDGPVKVIDALNDASSILGNLAMLLDKGDITPTVTADKFATALEERHGRQVVRVGEKLLTISRAKEKTEGDKQWLPVVNGKVFQNNAFIVEALNEKEAAKKMQIRFVNQAAEDKKLTLLIGPWLADGSKVSELSVELPKNFVDLHDHK